MPVSAAKIVSCLRPYPGQFGACLAQLFLISALDLLKPWPLQIVVDDVLSDRAATRRAALPWGLAEFSPLTLTAAAAAALILIDLGSGALTLGYNWTAIGLGQRMVGDLRGRLYAHLQRLSLAYHGRQRVGDLMLRVTGDSFAVQTMIMNGLLPIVSACVLLTGMLAVLWPLSPRLTLVALSILPGLFLLIRFFNRRITDIATRVRDQDSLVYSLAQWGIGAIKHVQAFTRERDEYRRFMAASGAALAAHRRLYAWQTGYSAVINTVVAAGTAIVILVGANEVLAHELSVGKLLVFLGYLGQLYAPVNQITQSWGLIAGARVGAARCFEVLDTEPDLADGSFDPATGAVKGRVAWQGVSYRYVADTPVLDRIDLDVPAGQSVALVGATGAGKSTLIGLLARFFDPTEGAVLLDGVDLRQYRIAALRRQIAMVLQPPLVFPLTVRENIAYGRPEATDADLLEAAREAQIAARIDTLPQGWDTLLGEGGVALSEGEKQRLSIARALVRRAPILVLDEPTSALDVETEAAVMAAIDAHRAGRTLFIIAHRLSTVRRADVILVLKDGIIAERGSFMELMALDRTFAALYKMQFDDSGDLPLAI